MFINSNQDFIYHKKGFVPSSVCESIIDYYENHPLKVPGVVYTGVNGDLVIDREVKDSMEVGCDFSTSQTGCLFHLHHYLAQLIGEYKKKYEFLNELMRWNLSPQYNIQKYDPMGGYFSLLKVKTGSASSFSASGKKKSSLVPERIAYFHCKYVLTG